MSLFRLSSGKESAASILKDFELTEWKDIPGYPGYKASDDGQIASFKKYSSGYIMAQHKSTNGYMRVNLQHGDKSTCAGVHRFVAMAFIPNPDNLPEVNHKNGDKTDNRVENLEWVTSSQNHLHAYRELGKQSAAKGKHFDRRAKLTPTEVRLIRTSNLGLSELAEYFGINESSVYNVRKKRTYKYID